MKKRVIVIGGGAAGFFCAANIDPENAEVTILEKQQKVLQKVRVSGGGRCNVTNACEEHSELLKGYPRGNKQLRQAFSRFFTTDTREWFEQKGLKLKAEADGRVFPVTDSSQDVINILEREVTSKGYKVWTGATVASVKKADDLFHVKLDSGNMLEANFLLIAAGGFNKHPQYDWIRNTGHKIIEPVPSLFTFNVPDKKIHEIKGNSVSNAEVRISGSNLVSAGPVLFTHWGFSGPAILKLSSYMARELAAKNYEFDFSVNWTGGQKQDEVRSMLTEIVNKSPEKKINNQQFNLSGAVWRFICERAGINEDMRWKDLQGKKFNVLVEKLTNDVYHASGKTTFKEEFVTCGGVDLSEVDFKTMESRIVSGLYFAGEILDIDGITGGYNFQAAWTTGFIAASSINSRLK